MGAIQLLPTNSPRLGRGVILDVVNMHNAVLRMRDEVRLEEDLTDA